MIKFEICPHDTEFQKGLEKWQKIANNLSSILDEAVILEGFKTYKEDMESISKEDNDLVYTYAEKAFELYENGYKPIGKIKKETDNFLVIGFKDKIKENDTIATALRPSFYIIPMLTLDDIKFENVKFKLEKSQNDIYKAVINKEVDFGIIYEDSYQYLKELYNKDVPIIKEIKTNLTHSFMVKPHLYDRLKSALLKFEDFELTTEEDFLKSLRFEIDIKAISKIRSLFDIASTIINSQDIGLAIYTDKILYKNPLMRELLEDQNINIEKIFKEKSSEVKKDLEKREKGSYFKKAYKELKINDRYFDATEQTVYYDKGFKGLSLFVDVTEQAKIKKLYIILSKIIHIATNIDTEEELYNSICNLLVESDYAKLVYISKVNEDNKISTTFSCGIKDNQTKDILLNSEITLEAYNKGEILIKQSKEYSKSLVAIPIKKNGKIAAIITICTPVPEYFQGETKYIIEEIQKEINYAIEKLEDIKENKILKLSIENSKEWVVMTNDKGEIEYINKYALELAGYDKEEVLGKKPSMFKSGYQDKEFYKKLWSTILRGERFEGIFINRKKNGEIFYLDQAIIPVKLKDGTKKFVSIGKDITTEKNLSQELERIKYYDIVTGLYNLNSFIFKASEYLSTTKNPAALLLIDIDNFSYYNKAYGIDIGDKILKELTNRIRNYIKEEDILARTGADEFSILFTNIEGNTLISTIKSIESIIAEDIFIDGKMFKIHFHSVLAMYPNDGKDIETLLENASLALKLAKKENEDETKFFNKDFEKQLTSISKAIFLVEKAIKNDLFIFHYQPYFDLQTGKIVGLEALVRIKDKDGTIYYPKDFIDFLESSPYLDLFEKFALKEVSKKIQTWQIPISVNISAKTFNKANFIDDIYYYTKNLATPLVIEVTERIYMNNIEKAKITIKKLKELNVNISIDDFGTGYSSLAYLKELNADILKIDMTFVKNMLQDSKSKALVKAIVDISKEFGIKSIAEGVETKEQYNMLKEMEVDYVQGFLLSKPLPEEDIESLLKASNANN
ncbi:EAL domain-containing protein [Hydrogenobaculum acidophilum]